MTREEILDIVDSEGFTPTANCIEYALKYYSYQNPLLYEEEFTGVSGEQEFQLSRSCMIL